MTCTLKHLAALVVEQGDCGPRPYVALENLQSGAGRLTLDELPQRDIADTGSCVVEPGDVLFGKLRPYLAKTWLVDRPVYASTELMALRPSISVEPRWLHYLVSSSPVIEWAVASSEGTKMPRTSWEKLRSMVIPDTPSLAHQQAIADYLDAETARIDALVEKKKQMVELLDERISSERSRAFDQCPGLPLKTLLRAPMAYGVLVPRFVEDGVGIPMLRIVNLDSDGGIKLDEVAWIEDGLAKEYARTAVATGDLVLSVVGSMGRASIIPEEAEGWNLNRALARLQPKSEVLTRLLWHWTQSREFMDQALMSTGSGAAQPTLNLGDLAQFRVGLPRDEAAWQGLLMELDAFAEKLRGVRDRLLRQVNLLAERRQGLITSAVTGQHDIPGVAA